jgi:hypothetical protein
MRQVNDGRGFGATLRTRGISVPTTDIASEVVLVVVLGLETADDEDEEEDDDEGNASTSR